MVYQIIKRDPNIMGFGALLALSLIATPILAAKAPEMLVVVTWMMPMGFLIAWGCQRASRFEAALPIAGRQLLLARMATLLTVLWLQAMAGAASGLLLSGGSGKGVALAMVESASIMTLVGVCLHALRPDQSRIPLWLGLAPVWLVMMALSGQMSKQAAQQLPPFGVAGAEWLTAGCLILSVAVFAWVWRRTPKAYRLAPDGAPRGVIAARSLVSPRSEARHRDSWAWMPVLRCIFNWQTSFVWLFLFYGGVFQFGGPPACLMLAMGWLGLRPRLIWLRALPVTRRIELAAIVVPALALLSAGYLAHGTRWFPDPHAQILVLFFDLGWALATLLVLALYDWRPLSYIRWGWRLGFTVLLIFPPPYLWMWLHPSVAAVTAFALRLPASLPLTVLVCAIPLLILTWALDRVYANTEYSTVPRMPQKEWFN